MPHRSYASTANYRFGFNGKENDNEPKGLGNQQDYGMRIYDARIGKFLSVDPLYKTYPALSAYQFASNTPIQSKDIDGGEEKHYILKWNEEHSIAKLVYSHDRDYFEKKTEYRTVETFGMDGESITMRIPSGTTTVKNPSQKYVVHGFVKVRLGIDGTFDVSEESVTWTFSSYEKMKATENSRKLAVDGTPFSDQWLSASSDQRWGIAVSQAMFSNLQAEMETGGMKGLWRGTPVTSKLNGRTIVIDEDLSPTIAENLSQLGYKVKVFPKGTLDADVIVYANKTNAIVMTANVKDYKGWGVTVFSVSPSMSTRGAVGTVVQAVEAVNAKAASNSTYIDPGKTVSLPEHKTNNPPASASATATKTQNNK